MGESRIENILKATIEGEEYTEPSGSRIETLLIELNELIIEGGGGGSSTAYATALSVTINSSTYVMTAQLLNKDGDPLGTAQTVDLPLESVVVGATYDNTTKSIILTLQSGSTTSVPVGDLVSGLVSTSDLETALATKQDTISDLSTIRSNATAGAGAATVVQGIDETGNNYIEMKSGVREYLSSTVPTGNIPTGSVGMGFDEGVWTYKSGTKVSEGILTKNIISSAINYGVILDFPLGVISVDSTLSPNYKIYYAPIKSGKSYCIQNATVEGYTEYAFYNSKPQNGSEAYNNLKETEQSSVVTFTAPIDGYVAVEAMISSQNVMINEGLTPLPYEPHGKQFSFYANGQSLTDYTIYGADGGVGDKTANLFDVSTTTHERITWATGAVQSDAEYTMSDYIPVDVGKTYTCSTNAWFVGYDSNGTYLGTYNEGEWNKNGLASATTFVNSATLNAAKIRLLKKATDLSTVMLNEGDTALPYEPYGYKIPVICGGETNIIYLANPLGANDSIDYATSQVAIPTIDGVNNLICDTTVQPSKVSLTYTGWHSDLDSIPKPETGMNMDTLYEGVTEIATNAYVQLAHSVTDYKLVIVLYGMISSGYYQYQTATIPIANYSYLSDNAATLNVTKIRLYENYKGLGLNFDEPDKIYAEQATHIFGVYGVK